MRISGSEHAKEISQMDLDGYAIGGLAVGETHEDMYRIIEAVTPYLPEDKPTYLMGVGTPANILEAVDRGVDFFDCVYPKPERTPRPSVHESGKNQSVQRQVRAGRPAHRGGLPVSGLPPLQQGLYPPSPEGEGDAGHAPVRPS